MDMLKLKKNIVHIVILSTIVIPLTIFLKFNFLIKTGNDMKTPEKTSKISGNNQGEIITVSQKHDSDMVADISGFHKEAILVDTHNDFVWKIYDKGADFGIRNSYTQSDLPKLKEGGVDLQVFAVWIPMNQVKRSFDFTVEQIERLKKFESEYFEEFEYAKSYEDILRIISEGKICGLIGIEGGTAIGSDANNVRLFYEMGVRYIGLTWNNSNRISTSAKDAVLKNKSGGLTEFGREVIKVMNETGMMIDVSHLSEAGFWDVMEISADPIIASHSNCYSINPHYRNLTDEQIKAIAESGGYIGINFYDEFLDEKGKSSGVGIDKVIEHIDHIKKIAGIDCIGIGSDFDGGITPPRELFDATQYPVLTEKLLNSEYTREEVKKILGENFLRVYKKVCK
ncbi:MAG: hypothetical protein HGGPFJEG_01690 [Ignavibacteria bacterium]|nr:hypothetical protein [Ignavibacteria bacterium]